MPSATLTTLSNILKEFYLPPVVEQLNNEVLLLQRLDKSSSEIVGKAVYVPVHTGRSGGIGARGESVQLPDPGAQSYARANYDLKYLYGRVRVSGPSMAKTSSDAGAFLQALRSELDGIRNDLKKDVARQIYGDGSGSIITVSAGAGVNTLTIASREPIDKGQLYVGMVIDIGTAANPTSVTGASTPRNITALNPATPSITFDGATVTAAGGEGVGRAGARAASSVSYEISGLSQMVSNAANTFGGIDSTAAGNGYWDNLRDTSGGALTLDKLMQAFNRVRIAGGQVSVLISSFGIQRAFYNLFQTNVRYVEPMKLAGGFQSVEFMGQPLVADIDAPWGKIFLLDERFIKVFSNRDWHFLDEDNSVLKWRSNFDEWEAVLARYMNIGATRRNVQMVVTATDTTGY